MLPWHEVHPSSSGSYRSDGVPNRGVAMQTYTCIDNTLRLIADPLCGEPPTAATLAHIDLPVKEAHKEITTFGPIPEELTDGVYKLSVLSLIHI